MLLSELLEAQEGVGRLLASFLAPKEQFPLLAMCRSAARSSVRREFFARTTWTLPPTRWLALQVLRDFSMKREVTGVTLDHAEWQQHLLVHFPSLKRVELRMPEVRTIVIELRPQHFPVDQIISLDLAGARVADLAPLAAFTKLEKLVLPSSVAVWNTHVLEGLKSLKSITVGAGEAAPNYSFIEQLEGLTELVVRSSQFNLKVIKGLKKLEILDITSCLVSDLEPLRDVAATLTVLRAGRTQSLYFRPDRATPFAALVNLRELVLAHSQFLYRSDLTEFSSLTKLTLLDLAGIHCEDLSPLARLTELETLVIKGCTTDWSTLRSLTKLKTLDQQARFTAGNNDAAAQVLASLPNLTTLTAPVGLSSRHPLLTVKDLTLSGSPSNVLNPIETKVDLAACCPNLVKLELSQQLDLKSIGVSKLKKLRALNLTCLDTPITKRGTGRYVGPRKYEIDYSPVASLRELEFLALSIRYKAKSYNFLAKLKNLTQLIISNQAIGNLSLLAGMTNLEHLVAMGAKVKDISALSRLRKLKVVMLNGTKVENVSSLRELPNLSTVLLPPTARCEQLAYDYKVAPPSMRLLNFHGQCLIDRDGSEGVSSSSAMQVLFSRHEQESHSVPDNEESPFRKRVRYHF